MNPFAEQDVYDNLEAKLPTNSGTEDEEHFTDELLAELSTTENGCPVKPIKYATKPQSSKTKTGNHFSGKVEKSPRRARRNARERGRKARLNAAFQVLKSIVSQTLDSSHDRKLTQVEILRLAKNYIGSLTTVLQACNDDVTTSYQNSSSFDNIF